MNQEDQPLFANIMKALAVNSGATLTAETLELYFKAFKQFSIEDIETACVSVLGSWIYPRVPPIAEILKVLKPQSIAVHRSVVVASEIVSNVASRGCDHFPEICDADPIAFKLMTERWPYSSWAKSLTDSQATWWVKEFCQAYEAYEASGGLALEHDTSVLGLLESPIRMIS